jgi:hypothetical protein
VDQVLLDIISISLGGAGLLTVLTEWNVPEANRSFYGDNPFLIKREAIRDTQAWVFGSLAAIALLLQLGSRVFGENLQERLYSQPFYGWSAATCLAATAMLVWLLNKLGRWLARRRWAPHVAEAQGALFRRVAFVIAHDGMAEEQLLEFESYKPDVQASTKARNMKDAERHLSQLERLFEVRPDGDLPMRVARLQRHLGPLLPASQNNHS